MLRLQWLSSSLVPSFNSELSPETVSNCKLGSLNSFRPLLTLTTTRKPSPKCQYSWNTQQQQQQSAFEPGSQTDSFASQTRAGGTSLSCFLSILFLEGLRVSCWSQLVRGGLMLFGNFGLCWKENEV